MSEYANKPKVNESIAHSSQASQQHKSKTTVQLVDNRTRTSVQKKQQEAMDNSPRVQQLKAYQAMADNYTSGIVQQKGESNNTSSQTIQNNENHTGLPDNLKTGVEQLSGMSMDDVRVHYNSSKPAQLQALAYAQGTDIHVGPGQEKHLPHEAWHVAQQKQGRVKATAQMKAGVNINDDKGLENEADKMGAVAVNTGSRNVINGPSGLTGKNTPGNVMQRLTGFEAETKVPIYDTTNSGDGFINPAYEKGWDPKIGHFLFGGLTYGATYGYDKERHFTFSADHNELMTAHRRIFSLLLMNGLLVQGTKLRTMANLEYISAARDEMGPEFKTMFEEDIAAIRNNLNDTLKIAKSEPGKVPDSLGIITGIPVNEIIHWLKESNIDKEVVEQLNSELLQMRGMITNELYMQSTTGVLPSKIPELFETSAETMKGSESRLANAMGKILSKSNKNALKCYNDANIQDEDFKREKASVTGFLSYLFLHMFSDMLSITRTFGEGSTNKNQLPFYPKVSLSKAYSALPSSIKKEQEWKILSKKLLEHFESFYQHETDFFKKLGLTYKPIEEMPEFSSVFSEDVVRNLYNLQISLDAKRPKTGATLSRLFEGDDEVHIGLERKYLPGLDIPNENLKLPDGEQAIPVEDRYFGSKFKGAITGDNFHEPLSDRANESIKRYSSYQQGEKPVLNIKDYKANERKKRITKMERGGESHKKRVLDLIKEQEEEIITKENSIKKLHRLLEINGEGLEELQNDHKITERELGPEKTGQDGPLLLKKYSGKSLSAVLNKIDKLIVVKTNEKNEIGENIGYFEKSIASYRYKIIQLKEKLEEIEQLHGLPLPEKEEDRENELENRDSWSHELTNHVLNQFGDSDKPLKPKQIIEDVVEPIINWKGFLLNSDKLIWLDTNETDPLFPKKLPELMEKALTKEKKIRDVKVKFPDYFGKPIAGKAMLLLKKAILEYDDLVNTEILPLNKSYLEEKEKTKETGVSTDN